MTGYGSETENKFTGYKEGYKTKNDFENDNICYLICNYNYYFDYDKKYKCTEKENWQNRFSLITIFKLIFKLK